MRTITSAWWDRPPAGDLDAANRKRDDMFKNVFDTQKTEPTEQLGYKPEKLISESTVLEEIHTGLARLYNDHGPNAFVKNLGTKTYPICTIEIKKGIYCVLLLLPKIVQIGLSFSPPLKTGEVTDMSPIPEINKELSNPLLNIDEFWDIMIEYAGALSKLIVSFKLKQFIEI